MLLNAIEIIDVSNKINGSLILGITGGVIVIASAIWQWKEKKESDKIAQQAQDSLRELNQKTLLTTQELAESYKNNALNEKARSEQLIQKTNELSESTKANARLQEELKNQVTGGDTKPTLQIITYKYPQPDFDGYVALFDVINKGKYPLNNIRAIVSDMDGFICAPYIKIERSGTSFSVSRPDKFGQEVEWKSNKKFDVGTLTLGNRHPLYAAVYSNTPKLWADINSNNLDHNETHYVIEINWNGGKLIYFLTFIITDGKFILTHYEGLLDNKPYDLTPNISIIAN